ncbi:MAG: FHA domain-containing protein [Planctomycetaceae bacterium]
MSMSNSNLKSDASICWYLSSQIEKDAPRAVLPITRRLMIGRQSGLDLTVPSAFVSGKHAELSCLNGRLVVHDLGSRNGTFVNGERIRRPTYLSAGDLLRLGDVKFRIHAQGATRDDAPHPLSQMNEIWIRNQMQELLRSQQFETEFDPICPAEGGDPIGFQASLKSATPGLETAEKMWAAAAWLGCEAELSRLVRRQAIDAAWSVAPGKMLFVSVHGSENLELEVLPALQLATLAVPELPIVVMLSDLETRDERSIATFLQGLRGIGIDWGIERCRQEQEQHLPVGDHAPAYARIHPALSDALASGGNATRMLVQELTQSLQKRRILVIAERITTSQLARQFNEIGVDLLQGPAMKVAEPTEAETLSGTLDFRLDDQPTSQVAMEHSVTATTTTMTATTSSSRKGLSTLRASTQGKTSPISIDLIRHATDWETF